MRRLILRPGAIGDCILAFPAMQQLASDDTELWITTAVAPLVHFAQTVRSLPATGIELVGIGDHAVPAKLTQHLASFDSIVSWYGSNRDEFQEALTAINPRCEFLQALPPPGYRGHATDFFCQQVGASDRIPRITLPACKSRETVVIHPFSGGRRKNWPLAAYQKLATHIRYPVEWTAGPEEQLAGAQRCDDLADLAQWIAGAKLYVGNDSGITHLAAAVGVPTLALFGPTEAGTWAPRGENVTVLRHEPITELSVEQVAETVNRLLA